MHSFQLQTKRDWPNRVPRRFLERHPCGQLALMPHRGYLRSATPQRNEVRGIVRGQTLIPSKTGSQTKTDVTDIWSVPVRQGGTDLPGMSMIRPVPNCFIVAGAPDLHKL
jgi:hypothetical protein